ncbi:ATP-binding protein [Psychrosphaera sp. G1-22]|uniref:histidine kinase n=1 Tax=Psychrosphaera algicola TaxID=3023714 RepID=A0ABT5FC72_9GAMM|nr:ATP-binding protein [Psychrosphaera sp. G1-22]MDC2889137.1 ATP-binding protein [Psychrosphaera sp. G1-22]
MSDELRSTIFYPMVTNKSDGNGLGLSISQTLIDQHQGTIEVDSWPGQTAFSIFIPVIQDNEGSK